MLSCSCGKLGDLVSGAPSIFAFDKQTDQLRLLSSDGSTFWTIRFCPLCGTRLSDSRNVFSERQETEYRRLHDIIAACKTLDDVNAVLGRPDRVIDSEGEEIESPSGVRRDSPCELIYRGLSAEIDLIAQWNGTTMGFAFLPKDPN